jgi:hypothetical protein
MPAFFSLLSCFIPKPWALCYCGSPLEDLFPFENLTAELLAPDGKSTLFMIERTDLSEDRKYME